jgi:hypothetical protein
LRNSTGKEGEVYIGTVANKTYEDDEFREPERLSTADLAGAGPEESVNTGTSVGTPVEVVRLPKEEEKRNPGTSETIAEPKHGRPISSAAPAAGTVTAMAKESDTGPLFSAEEAGKLRSQWDAIQVGFVDEPRKAVEQADSLVAVAMKRLAEQFAEERSKLEGHWDRGGDVSTEDLRLALRRYRSFFGRLLSV